MLTPDRSTETADPPGSAAFATPRPGGARQGEPAADSADPAGGPAPHPSAHWDSCSSLELAGSEDFSPRRRPGRAPTGRRSAPSRPLGDRARSLVDDHLGSSAKFLAVGGIVFLLDAAMYNLLVFWDPAHGWGQGIMHGSPLIAKLLTIAAASCLTYLGNRLWTFGDRPRPDATRSIILFILINVIAAGLQLSCLAFSRYVLGLDSVLADNISGTLIGQVVSTSFRYVTYGRFVFPRR